MYDVIVVGAGPAGSTAAKVLAEKGLRVLLVERHKLPRYKSCSGVLIQKSMDLVRRYCSSQEMALVPSRTSAPDAAACSVSQLSKELRQTFNPPCSKRNSRPLSSVKIMPRFSTGFHHNFSDFQPGNNPVRPALLLRLLTAGVVRV